MPVYGLLKRGGRVHALMIPDAKSRTTMGILRHRIQPHAQAARAAGGVLHIDFFRSYDVRDVSEFRPHRINHSQKFAAQRNHINGIANFWTQAKRNMRRYSGIPKDHIHLSSRDANGASTTAPPATCRTRPTCG